MTNLRPGPGRSSSWWRRRSRGKKEGCQAPCEALSLDWPQPTFLLCTPCYETNCSCLGQRNSYCSSPQVTCIIRRVNLCLIIEFALSYLVWKLLNVLHFTWGLSCVVIFVLLIWVSPRIKSLFPPECQAYFQHKPAFLVLLLSFANAGKSESEREAFKTKGSRTSVVLWSPSN